MGIFGAVLFDQPDQTEAAKVVLEGEGYDVDLQDQADGSVVLVAAPPTEAHTHSGLVERLELLAGQLGGEFIGHGGSAQIPLDQLDVDLADLHRGRD